MSSDIASPEVFRLFALLNASAGLDKLFPNILDLLLEFTHAERAFLMLYDKKRDLIMKAARNKHKENMSEEDFSGSTSIIQRVLKEKKPLYFPKLDDSSEFVATASIRRWSLQSAICIPLQQKSPESQTDPSLLGVIYMDSSMAREPLSDRDLQLAQTLAGYAAISIANAELYEEILLKNHEIESLNERLQNKLEVQTGNLEEMKLLLAEVQREVGKVYGLSNIVGRSKPMLKLFKVLEKVVRTHVSILILGESGTGKELIARHIHYNGPRAEHPIISINCSAFSEGLLESELFGHVKGSFTGATENKAGLFQLADGGSLFLDEVGDMSLEMQKKLLRVLQNGEIRPVGSKESRRVDVRIIAATHRSLKEMIKAGEFREDLYYRLNVITLEIPPLRERPEDVPLLVEYFTGKISSELNRPLKKLPPEVLDRFLHYDWPGNVRELENEIRRIYILESEYEPIRLDRGSTTTPGSVSLLEMEKRLIMKALEEGNGNKSSAAKRLGITRRTLYKKLIKHNIY